MRNVIIGADGGGTKTNLVALDAATGRKVATAATGSINVYFAGMEEAVANMKAALAALELQEDDRILALAIGDPAMDDSSPEDGLAFRNRVKALLPAGALCLSKSDVFMALYAFTGGMPGALMVAGTGSMGIGLKNTYCHNSFQPPLTVGGWGEPTTDPGSGNDIAVRGICAAMNAFDGIRPDTALCRAVQDFCGTSQPRGLVGILNGEEMTRSKIAAFSREVARCADAGDPVSMEILQEAGLVLGKYACSLLRQIGAAVPVGAYGSVLIHNGCVRRVFTETIHKEFPQAQVSIPDTPPEYGAARFAAHALGIRWEEEK